MPCLKKTKPFFVCLNEIKLRNNFVYNSQNCHASNFIPEYLHFILVYVYVYVCSYKMLNTESVLFRIWFPSKKLTREVRVVVALPPTVGGTLLGRM